MSVVYNVKGNTYTVSKCSLSDIDSDYELIRTDVDDCSEEEYKKNMILSVESDVSYRVVDKNGKLGFLYSYIKDGVGNGASTYNGGLHIGFICLLKELVKNYPSHKIIVLPHKGNVGYIRSLVTGYSIRNCHNGVDTLVIKINELRDKISYLCDKVGIV